MLEQSHRYFHKLGKIINIAGTKQILFTGYATKADLSCLGGKIIEHGIKISFYQNKI
jgi:hypothetical protein